MPVVCVFVDFSFLMNICLQQSGSGVLAGTDSSLPRLCGATLGTGRWGSWDLPIGLDLLPQVRAGAYQCQAK